MILRYEQLNENKMWYKTIPQILEWINSKSKMNWVWIDTETTGLGGPNKQQLTQVSGIVTQYDFANNSFKVIASGVVLTASYNLSFILFTTVPTIPALYPKSRKS